MNVFKPTAWMDEAEYDSMFLVTRGVTVNTLAPGLTDTDGMVLGPEQVQGLIAQTPLGRLGRPEDVADAVALLVSPDAHWVTMQNARATGGIV